MPSAVSFLIQPTDLQPLPSGADQFLPSSWLLLLGGWGKMTVTLAIDSTLTHWAPTLPQTHWFLFWLSLENTKKVRPVRLWKMKGVSFLNGYQFKMWCFPGAEGILHSQTLFKHASGESNNWIFFQSSLACSLHWAEQHVQLRICNPGIIAWNEFGHFLRCVAVITYQPPSS